MDITYNYEKRKYEGSVDKGIPIRAYVAHEHASSVNFRDVSLNPGGTVIQTHSGSYGYYSIRGTADSDVQNYPIHFTQLSESVIRAIYNEIIVANPSGLPTNNNLYRNSAEYTVIDINDIPKTENINLLRSKSKEADSASDDYMYGYKYDVNKYIFCYYGNHHDDKPSSANPEKAFHLMSGYFGFEDNSNNNFKFFIDKWSSALYSQISDGRSDHPTQIDGSAENKVNMNLYNSIKLTGISSQDEINEKITITLYNMFYGKNPIITSNNSYFKSYYTQKWQDMGVDSEFKLSENEELVIINKDDGTIHQ